MERHQKSIALCGHLIAVELRHVLPQHAVVRLEGV
jgi:hypothetical protein